MHPPRGYRSKDTDSEESDLSETVQNDEGSTTNPLAEEDQDERIPPERDLPTVSERYIQQVPSSTGKVAYVIFEGRHPGLWYNWSAVRAHLNTYLPREEPRYKGYTTYRAAREAYALHLTQQTAIRADPPPMTPTCVPLSPGHSVQVHPAPTRLLSTPSNHRGSPAKMSPTPGPRSKGKRADNPRASPAQAPRRADPQMMRPPRMLSAISGQELDLFFIVLEGYNPGVYNSRIDAQRASGALNSTSGIMQNTSQDEANRLFVDAYMTGRVKKWNS